MKKCIEVGKNCFNVHTGQLTLTTVAFVEGFL